MKKVLSKFGILGMVMLPYLVHAQTYVGSATTGNGLGSVKEIVDKIGKFVSTTVMPIIVALGFLYFIWNMGQYILNLDKETEREKFKKYWINGLLGLFIMVSLWGIIAIGTQTVFNSQPVVPQFRTK
jgi:hypothetical protein